VAETSQRREREETNRREGKESGVKEEEERGRESNLIRLAYHFKLTLQHMFPTAKRSSKVLTRISSNKYD